jgi:hypothetical protein
MADWDTAALLADAKLEAGIPAESSFPTDANWYSWLASAQEHWMGQIATQCPWLNLGAPVLLATTDSGLTYYFANDDDGDPIHPLAVQLYNEIGGRPLIPGNYWDPNADYVWMGDHIRFPRNKTKTFSSGPYARYVAPPERIDVSTQPTLKPKRARKLIVYRACILYATRGGKKDPHPFYRLEAAFWIGNPTIGDLGLLGELKQQNPFGGMESFASQPVGILEGVNTGVEYTPA